MNQNQTIACRLCGAQTHFMELHLEKHHPGVSMSQYRAEHPDAPEYSEAAWAMLIERKKKYDANEPRKFSVRDTFGFCGIDNVAEVSGFSRPTEFVPPLEENYAFREGVLYSVLYALEKRNQPLLLIGPTGSGKTSVVEQVCARLNRPVTRVNLDGDVTRSDFVGQWVLNGEQRMDFRYGPLPTAMREGHVLIVDEIDAGAAPVVMVLQAVLEGKPLVIMETGETVKPHPDFRICATANTNGQGDESGMYYGTQPQNYAMFDRFKIIDRVDYPTASEEGRILKKAGVENAETRGKLIDVAKLIREAHVKGECSCTMSTRNVVNIAEKLAAFGEHRRAYELSFLNRLNSDDLAFCGEIVQRVWG